MSRQRVIELFGIPTANIDQDWAAIAERQYCPYLERSCIKTRKSLAQVALGTCTVTYGVHRPKDILICPQRMLDQGSIFIDCLHLLELHEPGNELHKIPQVEIPGGSVDYFLVSLHNKKVVDFVGLEVQTLDTTGTVWPARQLFLQSAGLSHLADFDATKSFGINWKMTAKTILMQLHHKIGTFESLGKHLVLAMQDVLLEYMMREFRFEHIKAAKREQALHFHAYAFEQRGPGRRKLRLASRHSTDKPGMAAALGLQAPANVPLETVVSKLQSKISPATRLPSYEPAADA